MSSGYLQKPIMEPSDSGKIISIIFFFSITQRKSNKNHVFVFQQFLRARWASAKKFYAHLYAYQSAYFLFPLNDSWIIRLKLWKMRYIQYYIFHKTNYFTHYNHNLPFLNPNLIFLKISSEAEAWRFLVLTNDKYVIW
ncbi:MAG: hypothetical protein ACD_2C00176G0002 [uncultured bacterium (gcode 4)]|uniref:Uncharacterized protein n=1 Tax=uncultured bacterium (gcode 4) TaxID=1234023 RepID=K2FE53_9BACT|nr:MAG: hypothetical protein ACD_2C00176G0002 [uncultured bacterium (gcode 4)]